MPTVFSHAIAATALGQWWPGRRLPARFWLWTAAGAALPDVDVIGFPFGIPYEDMLGHRGLTHSLPFAIAAGALVARHLLHTSHPSHPSHRHALVLYCWFIVVIASHGVMDALTNGGLGIAFFAPFSNHRYFFPWRPIQVSPIGPGFLSARGLGVLVSEARWIWLPSAIMAASARIFRK